LRPAEDASTGSTDLPTETGHSKSLPTEQLAPTSAEETKKKKKGLYADKVEGKHREYMDYTDPDN